MFEKEQILQGKYQLKQRLGRTAAGRQTWLAVDRECQEKVTVKLLAFSPEMAWEELKLFEREAQVLQALNHPRIPRYRNYFSLDKEDNSGIPWFGLVQDYIPGASLQDLLEEGKHFSEDRVHQFAEEVLEILIYLHHLSPPVLHRDIKPSNLILGEDEQIYLVDFGSVQAQAAVTGVTFTVVGTGGYAPLEQFWGRAVAASDLYALGATLIHLLTGIPPVDLPHQDSRIQFSHLVSLKEDFVSWLEKMTETGLDKRFSDAKQALNALENEMVVLYHQVGKSRKISKLRKSKTPFYLSSTNKLFSFIKKSKNSFKPIKVYKSAKHLKIIIPPRFLRSDRKLNDLLYKNLEIIPMLIFFIFWLFFYTFASIQTNILHPIVADFILSLLPYTPLILITIPFFILLLAAHINRHRETEITCNEEELILKKFILVYLYSNQKVLLKDILGVFLEVSSNPLSKGVQIIFRTKGGRTYRSGGNLTDKEATLVAKEIQDWLYLQ